MNDNPLHSQDARGLRRFFFPQPVTVSRSFESLQGFVALLPACFRTPGAGRVIYRGRNELREFDCGGHKVVVKAFCKPSFINRIAYGVFRKSKAQRSFEYAMLLRSHGIGSPAPIGWTSRRCGLFFADSYYASLRSGLPYTYIDLMTEGRVPEAETLLREVGRVAGRMHNLGMIHRDFSRGNLLVGMVGGKPCVEVIDLNRIRFHAISKAEGLAGFSRLPATPAMKRAMAEGYAEVRGYDAEECLRLWPETVSMSSRAAGERV